MSVTFTSLERLTHLSKATTGTAQSLIKVRWFGGKLVSLLCSAELLLRNTLCCNAKKKNAIACSSTSVTRICLKPEKISKGLTACKLLVARVHVWPYLHIYGVLQQPKHPKACTNVARKERPAIKKSLLAGVKKLSHFQVFIFNVFLVTCNP